MIFQIFIIYVDRSRRVFNVWLWLCQRGETELFINSREWNGELLKDIWKRAVSEDIYSIESISRSG